MQTIFLAGQCSPLAPRVTNASMNTHPSGHSVMGLQPLKWPVSPVPMAMEHKNGGHIVQIVPEFVNVHSTSIFRAVI